MQRLLDGRQIGQTELGLDHLDVGDRIDLASDVDHVAVFKTAHHIDRGVGLANVSQKLVTQPLTRAGTCHQTGNIDKFNNRALDFLRVHDGRQCVETRIRHLNDPDIGFNRAKGIVLGRDAGLGQRVEQGRFTDVGQAHDATFQTHENILRNQCPSGTIEPNFGIVEVPDTRMDQAAQRLAPLQRRTRKHTAFCPRFVPGSQL